MFWLFLLAYTLSGLAGLIYEVSWTRLLTLYIGHTTAAASAVVAAFLGGLAAGAAGGGTLASRLAPRRSLQAYAGLEIFVAVAALLVPIGLRGLTPLLESAYRNGDPGAAFPLLRVAICLVLVFIPALALGATFPLAIRWSTHGSADPAPRSGGLYAANTLGAAAGALLAGFVLIPAIGVSGAIRAGMAASVATALLVGVVLWFDSRREAAAAPRKSGPAPRRARRTPAPSVESPDLRWLIALTLGISGFASLTHEIVWTRILALVLGPTVYAFSATLAAVIGGVALGGTLGVWLSGRTRAPALWLALTLIAAAVLVSVTSALAGGEIPRLVAREVADATNLFGQLQRQGALLTIALIVPTSVCMGVLFPLAFAAVARGADTAAARFGSVYAVNTIGAVSGSLATGFFLIPRLGLQTTLVVVSSCLITAALIVSLRAPLSSAARAWSVGTAAIAAIGLLYVPSWDRELLASGVYLYAPDVPKGLDREALLKAGTLLYYREGASATVSVKKLTGTTTLAVDGKVDASNRRDMLTQKLIAHLPLMIHGRPRQVGVVGLGSGVTVGAALRHPIDRVDVVEISPEVVEASRFFEKENRAALADPRTHLIVGDGRSHLMLSGRQYDVIVSEPSNPWIAGVAALFTREFFAAVSERLAPGGIVCQWAHTYNISDSDLRSIVATFRSVFPNGTAWMIGGDDVLLVASREPLDDRLGNIAKAWEHGDVAADLVEVGVADPFPLYSLFAGGPAELGRYTEGATILTDDRMSLEFSAPRQLHQPDAQDNSGALLALLDPAKAPPVVREAIGKATAASWRNLADMLAKSDVYGFAYDNYVKALQIDPTDQPTLDGLMRTAVLTQRTTDALSWLNAATLNRAPATPALVTRSKLLAASGAARDALDTAIDASQRVPIDPRALEQLASLHADAADIAALDAVVARLQQAAPSSAAAHYYSGVSAFLHGQPADAVAHGERAVAADPAYAAAYDLLGAAYTRAGQGEKARSAFEKSLEFNAHDSTAYTNLGLLELAAGNRGGAANLFAEALWLAPESPAARRGLADASTR